MQYLYVRLVHYKITWPIFLLQWYQTMFLCNLNNVTCLMTCVSTFSVQSFYPFTSWFCLGVIFLTSYYHLNGFFRASEPKAQVSSSDHNLSVVRRCRCCCRRNFSHFHLLLQNHWANFNQTWHKTFLGDGDSSLFKWRTPPFSKGR